MHKRKSFNIQGLAPLSAGVYPPAVGRCGPRLLPRRPPAPRGGPGRCIIVIVVVVIIMIVMILMIMTMIILMFDL